MGIKDTLQKAFENKSVRLAIIAIFVAIIIFGVAYVILILPENYRLEGDSYMSSGLYEEAISAYDKALWFRPDEGVVLSHKGDALLGLSAYDDAFPVYEHAARSGELIDWATISQILEDAGRVDLASKAHYYLAQANPASIDSWYKLGELQSQLGNYENAAASYDRVTQLAPESATLWLRKAETLAKLGYYQDAITAYDRAISIEPELLIAYVRKAEMQEAQGNYEGALATIDAALGIYPESVQGLMLRSNILIQLDRYSEAVTAKRMANEIQERYVPGKRIDYQDFSKEKKADKAYQGSLERQIAALSSHVEPEMQTTFLLMSSYLANLKDSPAEAMRLSKQALTLNPSPTIATAAWANIGHAYIRYREYENAESAFQQAITKNNENQVAFSGLAHAHYMMGQYPQAIDAAERALAIDVGDADSWLWRGLALANNGNAEEAYRSLLRADALRSQHVETLNGLTRILYERGEIERALSLADQVISLSSNNAQAWYYRAWALLKLGEYGASNEAFNRAMHAAPRNAYSWFGKGQLYESLKKRNDALQMYNQALLLRPGDPVFEEAQMYIRRGDMGRVVSEGNS